MSKNTYAVIAVFGFLSVAGAVGGMEDPANSLAQCVGVALAGLGLMYAGVNGIKEAV